MTKICIVCGTKFTDDSALFDYSDGLWCWKCDDKYRIEDGQLSRVQDNRPVPKYKVKNWEKYRYRTKNEYAQLSNVEVLGGHKN